MSRNSTLNVSLTTTLRNYVNAKLRSGRYESASEVIRDGLRALQERERVTESFWAGVREKVAIARRQVADGRTVDGESAMNEILRELGEPLPRHRKRKTARR